MAGFCRMERVWGSVVVVRALLNSRGDLTAAQRLKWEMDSSSVRPPLPISSGGFVS